MDIGEMSFRELPFKFGDGEEALPLSDWEEEYFSYIRGGQSPGCDQDLFEFSSGDFSASCDALNLPDNVVFCGKFIPYREAQVPIRVQEMETNNSNRKLKEAGKRSSWPLFTWRSNVKKSRMTSSSTSKQVKRTNEDGNKLAATIMPVLSPPLKSRWYFFALGVGRFPMVMEQRDMKTRQSKKSRANYPTNDRREMSNSGSSNRTSILWSILNNIGCKNQYLYGVSSKT